MRITLITVGKLKEKYLKDGIDEYKKRLSRFCDLEIIEVEDEQTPENASDAQEVQIKKKEADRIIKKMKAGTFLIALEIEGLQLDSNGLAEKMKSIFLSGNSNITFLIGGSLGLDQELIKRADLRLSLSKLTFPHQLARLLLLEQVYRVYKMINGETYHK
jgi:23S rRNA (pseudouridine1915-N3)-methyltransferase